MAKINELIREQYMKYPYPEPVRDMVEYLKTHEYEESPSYLRHLLWPKKGYPEQPFQLLCAGCGANQAAGIALRNPLARVTGIDLSETSLEHCAHLRDKHAISNLELKKLDLHEVETLGRKFDVILSNGVLHHLPDPETGFRALREVLAPEGVFVCMVYGKYGRAGAYMFQDIAELMGLKQDAKGVETLRELCGVVSESHPVHNVAQGNQDFGHDAEVVDLFLNPQDTPFTVREVLDMAGKTDFVFQAWADNMFYSPYPYIPMNTSLFKEVTSLPVEKQWELMEIFTGTISKHTFILTHPDRDPRDYEMDFRRETMDQYIPVWTPHIKVAKKVTDPPFGNMILERRGLRFNATPQSIVLFKYMDQGHTALECGELARRELQGSDLDFFSIFNILWNMGHIQLRKS